MEKNLPKENIRIDEFVITGFSEDYVFRTIRDKRTFYESETLELWTPLLGELDTILDVGANLGNHTLFWSRIAKHIYAFEPYAPNYENLQQNIRQNRLERVVTTIQKAVGRDAGHAVLSNVDDRNFGATTFQLDDGQHSDSYEVISLDQFVQDARLSSVDLIKIDTEGFEIDVLRGALTLIQNMRPFIWVEVTYQTFEEVMKILKEQQYDLADVEGFNMIFFPKEKNVHGLHAEQNKLLSALFLYETKMNTYYKNYETAKEWHQASVAKSEALQAECDRLKERCNAAEKNYQTAKKWHEASTTKAEALQAEHDRLEQLFKEKQELQLEDVQMISAFISQDMQTEELLNQLMGQMNKLQAQASYLKKENAAYREKLDKIKSVWYGRLGIAVYKKSQELSRRIRTKFKR